MLEVLNFEKKQSKKEQATEIIQFLNLKTGRRYRPTQVNLNFIYARLKEGYTIEEIRAVIAMKVREWQYDDLMSKYLRPATLFNNVNFNQYAGELGEDVS